MTVKEIAVVHVWGSHGSGEMCPPWPVRHLSAAVCRHHLTVIPNILSRTYMDKWVAWFHSLFTVNVRNKLFLSDFLEAATQDCNPRPSDQSLILALSWLSCAIPDLQNCSCNVEYFLMSKKNSHELNFLALKKFKAIFKIHLVFHQPLKWLYLWVLSYNYGNVILWQNLNLNPTNMTFNPAVS